MTITYTHRLTRIGNAYKLESTTDATKGTYRDVNMLVGHLKRIGAQKTTQGIDCMPQFHQNQLLK